MLAISAFRATQEANNQTRGKREATTAAELVPSVAAPLPVSPSRPVVAPPPLRLTDVDFDLDVALATPPAEEVVSGLRLQARITALSFEEARHRHERAKNDNTEEEAAASDCDDALEAKAAARGTRFTPPPPDDNEDDTRASSALRAQYARSLAREPPRPAPPPPLSGGPGGREPARRPTPEAAEHHPESSLIDKEAFEALVADLADDSDDDY